MIVRLPIFPASRLPSRIADSMVERPTPSDIANSRFDMAARAGIGRKRRLLRILSTMLVMSCVELGFGLRRALSSHDDLHGRLGGDAVREGSSGSVFSLRLGGVACPHPRARQRPTRPW